MPKPILFDVIIIGGSYAGLSAAMALGRSLRRVLVIDSGTPCNAQTPHSHNFVTHDGTPPAEIARLAKQQVSEYPNVTFVSGLATEVTQGLCGFDVKTWDGEYFTSRKLLLATGIEDIMPEVDGASECWGISLIHCPYCHGYEYRNEKTGILANGEMAFEMARLVSNWTKDLTIFTDGDPGLTADQIAKLNSKNIEIIHTEVEALMHESGYMTSVVLSDGSKKEVKAIYTRPAFIQQSDIAEKLGCEFQPSGHIKVDPFQKTTIPGVYAAGDNCFQMRSVPSSVFAGSLAGSMINRELIDEDF
ncbi:NAD(P)/FAD-dependent oxidoreductase [Flavobacterium selenitireducens]|uniref:NAD(P)/FAD-dependent oxidoreductase n=1 Tax=Flavobacterium selenitireducens TaxID=2722704 RepID=UPI00168B64C0|nr:NAD(P)/FAD-dependent oxidoreductase [Flavobacterium selenitireducens]MBD3583200.1 NAD(P)/FAD-dependent oxidoreductase [Flavobacterium selenitireducens]